MADARFFDIRVELPGSGLWDFRVAAAPQLRADLTKKPAFQVARECAEKQIRETRDVRSLEWRGMVCFVNRPIPLERR